MTSVPQNQACDLDPCCGHASTVLAIEDGIQITRQALGLQNMGRLLTNPARPARSIQCRNGETPQGNDEDQNDRAPAPA